MEKLQHIAIYTFILLIPVAWTISSLVAGYKEKNRHSEVTDALVFFIAQQKDNAAFATYAVQELARQKSLIVMRDEDGVISVRALDTAGKDEAREALKADRPQ